jgi:hypothetical protein
MDLFLSPWGKIATPFQLAPITIDFQDRRREDNNSDNNDNCIRGNNDGNNGDEGPTYQIILNVFPCGQRKEK